MFAVLTKLQSIRFKLIYFFVANLIEEVNMKRFILSYSAIFFPDLICAHGVEGHMGGSWYMGNLLEGGWIMWILLLVIVIAVVYFLVKLANPLSSSKTETPLDILKKRYASGEISQEEFEKMKKDLI